MENFCLNYYIKLCHVMCRCKHPRTWSIWKHVVYMYYICEILSYFKSVISLCLTADFLDKIRRISGAKQHWVYMCWYTWVAYKLYQYGGCNLILYGLPHIISLSSITDMQQKQIATDQIRWVKNLSPFSFSLVSDWKLTAVGSADWPCSVLENVMICELYFSTSHQKSIIKLIAT